MVAPVLQRPTLVLNRNWQPFRVTTVARALILVVNGAARVVDPEDYQAYDWSDWSRVRPTAADPVVRTIRYAIRVPEVISLTRYGGLPARAITFSRRNVFRRDRNTCQYCGERFKPEELTIDHVIPRSRGGQSNWTNCVLACVPCNKRKSNRTPEQSGMALLSIPDRPAWRPLHEHDGERIPSWDRFLSQAYWDAELTE